MSSKPKTKDCLVYKNIKPLNSQREFDDLQKQRLGNYIYALKDPRDNKIFYVGQSTSKSDRVFSHMREAENLIKGEEVYSSKRARIIDIWSEGEDVEWVIIAHNLPAESVDHIESAIINTLEISQNGQCLNIVRAPNSSFLNSGDVKELGAKTVDPTLKKKRLFIFPCNKAIRTSKESIYESTRAAWQVVAEHRQNDSFAIGVKNGISLGGFKIKQWERLDKKYAFIKECNVPELTNVNWTYIINSTIGYWQRGNYLIIELNGQGKFKFIRGCSDKGWKQLPS